MVTLIHVLVKYNSDFTTGKFFPSYFDKVSNIDVVTYPEYTAGHYNYTGAAIGGFDVSSSSYIVAQSTVDLDYINTSETRNVYVSRCFQRTFPQTSSIR